MRRHSSICILKIVLLPSPYRDPLYVLKARRGWSEVTEKCERQGCRHRQGEPPRTTIYVKRLVGSRVRGVLISCRDKYGEVTWKEPRVTETDKGARTSDRQAASRDVNGPLVRLSQ